MSDSTSPHNPTSLRADLLAQCEIPPVLSREQAEKLPIHVDKVGAEGPRVLIIHGGIQGAVGGGPTTFAKQKILGEREWRVEIPDRPGFGQSPTRGVDDMVEDAIWISDMLGQGAHLIGHSWGGATALLAAARNPGAVHSLILVEPALQTLAMSDAQFMQAADIKDEMIAMTGPLFKAKTLAELGRAMALSVGVIPSGPSSTSMTFEVDDKQAAQLGCAFLQSRIASATLLKQAAETIRDARIPVLLIRGGWSTWVDKVSDCVARLLNGDCVKVNASNHFPQLENSEEFNAVIESFMRNSSRHIRSDTNPGI